MMILAAEEAGSILEKLHLNWLVIAVVIIVIAGVIIGANKGAFKMIFTVIAIVLAISLTILISPITKAKLMSSPKIYDFFYEKTEKLAGDNQWAQLISQKLEEKGEEPSDDGESSVELLNDLLDTMGVPEKYKESIAGDESVIRNMEISADADTNERAENVQKGVYTGITNVVVKAVAFLITLFIVGIILAVLGGFTNLLAKIPGVDKVNAIVGAIAGGLIALVIIWVLFAGATALSATGFGQTILAMIKENRLLTFIYEHNFITSRILS